MDVPLSNSDTDTENSERCDEGFHQVEHIDDESEFWGTKFEYMAMLEGPQLILQLILQ